MAFPPEAMLMFGAEAGPVRNKAGLQGFFEIITERLQRLYMTSRFSSTLHAEKLCPPLCELGHIFQRADRPNVVMPSSRQQPPRLGARRE